MNKKKIFSSIVFVIALFGFYFIGKKLFDLKTENAKYNVLKLKIENFKKNENYNLALKSFNDTLPALLKHYAFENSPKDSYSNRPLLSTGPVLFNSQFTKCAVMFYLAQDFRNEKPIQPFFCMGDRKNKWTFYSILVGMHGMKYTDTITDEEIEVSLKDLIKQYHLIDDSNSYNNSFVNDNRYGIPNPRVQSKTNN